MKVTITFEIEVSDIPENDRLEMLSDGGMEDGDMPRISAMSETRVRAEIIDAFYALFDGATYDEQSEMWAGSNFYGYITGIIADPAPRLNVLASIEDGMLALATRSVAVAQTPSSFVQLAEWAHSQISDAGGETDA